MFDSVVVGFIEALHGLRDGGIVPSTDFDRGNLSTGFLDDEELHLRSRLFPIESDIMSFGELTFEFEEEKVFEDSLFCHTLIVGNGECSIQVREVIEV